MISFSIMFHLASAIAFLVLSIVYAREKSRVQFLRRWMLPDSGFMVNDPVHGLRLFANALGINFEMVDLQRSESLKSKLVKLKLNSLMAIHSEAQIVMIRVSPGSPLKVALTLASKMPLNPVHLSTVERDFSEKIQVVVD